MEQDDEEFEQLLGEIPRATSAPPHLEELQRAYGAELSNSPFVVSVGEVGHALPPVKPFIDIRCDEQYENFYRAYSGVKKLPPPMSLYAEYPSMGDKSTPNHLSPFFSGLALDSPRNMAVQLRPRPKQEQVSANDNSGINSVRASSSSPPSDRQYASQSSLPPEDCSLSSAFGSLSFEESASEGMVCGRHHEENGVGGDSRGSSNGGLDHSMVVGNGRGGPVSGALYAHLNPFSSGFGSESASLVEALVNASPSPTMELFSQKTAGTAAGIETPSNGSYGGLEGLDGQTAQALEKYLMRASPPGVDNHTFSSSGRLRNGVSMEAFAANSVAAHAAAANQQHYGTQYSSAVAAARSLHPPISFTSKNGNDHYANGCLEYDGTSARALQQQAHKLQIQLEAEQRAARERQFQQMQQQQQQMKFYASLQAHANGAVGNGLGAYPSSRGHSPSDSSARQSSLQQVTGVAVNHVKASRNHDQLWNVQPGVVSQNNGDGFRNSLANSICRYFAQGYCSRGDACPFLHSQVLPFGSGRAPCGSTFKDVSVEERFLAEKMHPRSRVASRIANGHVLPATTAVPRRKAESVPNDNTSLMSGHAYANGNQHPSPVVFPGDVQNYVHLDHTFEYDGTRHPVVGAQHLAPQNQQPKYNTLEEVEGKIFSIAKDQHGCRFLQRKFDEGGPEDVKKIFYEIIDHIIELMTDPFGNYLVQKLLEVCNEAQRMEILHVVTGKGELVTISLNMHGTRAVQKLIETLKSPEQVAMVIASLRQGVVTLIKDLNGNHVVQRCLQRLDLEDSQFIFDAAAVHCVEIATHRHGCCVLQRCVDYATGAQRDRLVAEIAANALVLSQDPFGNYVVQYILDLSMPWASVEVMVRLENHYPYLAMQKFSSNVVEKCLKLATEENRTRVVRELMASPRLGQMLQDPYANYVVQSALTVAKGSLHTGLVDAIRPHLSVLRSSPYGKRILSRTNLKK